MRVDERSYLAGIFDGEGSVHGRRLPGRNSWNMYASVSLTHKATLNRFKKLYGGSVTVKKVPEGRRPMWVWQVGGANAIGFFIDASELCSIKRRQAKLALKMCTAMARYHANRREHKPLTPKDIQWRDDICATIQQMNSGVL